VNRRTSIRRRSPTCSGAFSNVSRSGAQRAHRSGLSLRSTCLGPGMLGRNSVYGASTGALKMCCPGRTRRSRRRQEPAAPDRQIVRLPRVRSWVMFADRRTAKRIESLMRSVSRQLNTSIRLVMDTRPESEFHAYRRAAGFVMERIFTDIMTPIYQAHPDLVPPGLEVRGAAAPANQRARGGARPRNQPTKKAEQGPSTRRARKTRG